MAIALDVELTRFGFDEKTETEIYTLIMGLSSGKSITIIFPAPADVLNLGASPLTSHA